MLHVITATILIRLLFVQKGQPKPRNIPNNHTNICKNAVGPVRITTSWHLKIFGAEFKKLKMCCMNTGELTLEDAMDLSYDRPLDDPSAQKLCEILLT